MVFSRPSLSCRPLQIISRTRSFSSTASQGENAGTIHGTAPPHAAYLFLPARHPPSQFAKIIDSDDLRDIKGLTKKWPAEKKCLVNMSWAPNSPKDGSKPETLTLTLTEPGDHDTAGLPVLHTIYGGAHYLRVPEKDNTVAKLLSRVTTHIENKRGKTFAQHSSQSLYIYVCTHGAVDCRCGEHGSSLVEALKSEVERRRDLWRKRWKRVHVLQTGHVGGHKYAANMLVFPFGDWYGNLRQSDATKIIDSLTISSSESEIDTETDKPSPPEVLMPHWRGRMGMSEEQTRKIAERHNAP